MDVTCTTGTTAVVEGFVGARVAPGSAKVVPKYGTNVEAEQQFPLYSQQKEFDPVSQLMTLTEVLFPAELRAGIRFEVK